MSAELALQTGVYERLTLGQWSLYMDFAEREYYQISASQAEGITDLASVYDHVPQDAAFPYVVIGDDTMTEWDTDTEQGFEATITIHTWTQANEGRAQCKSIMDAIYTKLHKGPTITVDGYDTVDVFFEFSQTMLDPDGLTIHGVQRLRVILREE